MPDTMRADGNGANRPLPKPNVVVATELFGRGGESVWAHQTRSDPCGVSQGDSLLDR
jgi:hypothetical protein